MRAIERWELYVTDGTPYGVLFVSKHTFKKHKNIVKYI